MATTEAENKELVQRAIEEAFNSGNVAVLDDVLADGFVAHAPAEPGHGPETQDRDRLEEEIKRNRAIFPDLTFDIQEMIAEGNAVAVRWKLHGTHEGAMPGVEPTGKEVTVRGMNFMHIEDGRIAEDWVLWDSLNMMQQLGIGPEPPGE